MVAIAAALCLPARAQDATATPPPDAAAQPAATQTVPVALPDDDDPNAVKLEEVVVTSTKRAKSQRDIPGSVAAIRGEDLEKMHAQGLGDYLKLVPGVTYMDQGDETSVPIIRGIASDITFGSTQITTGIYMEDMPFADLFGPASVPDLNPFDLERVEVLKGPQGTLFGSGALAGAIRYIVEKPHMGQWEVKISETASRTDESDGIHNTAAAALNIPIGDTLAFRVVGVYRKDPGTYDMSAKNCTPNLSVASVTQLPGSRLIGSLRMLPAPIEVPFAIEGSQACNGYLRNDPDADRERQLSGRVLAAWNPIERLKISAFYFVQKTHRADYGLAHDPGQLASSDFPFASPSDHDFSGGNLLMSYDFDWARLTSSSNRMTKHNYRNLHQEWGLGLGNQNAIEYENTILDNVHGWTQEVRLSSPEGGTGIFEWLIGASYLHYGNSPNLQDSYIGPDMPDPTDPSQVDTVGRNTAQVFATADQLATEKAVFGEITTRAGGSWEFTLGARAYKTGLKADTLTCGAQITAFFPESALTNGCHPQHFDDQTGGFNPKASIRYIHNRHVQWYLLAAKGFQFGGIQINPPAPGFEQSANNAGFAFGPYKSSNLWNYETGIRTDWWSHRLRFDVGAFYLDWRDLQLTVTVPFLAPQANVPFAIIANVGHAHSAGVEATFDVLPFAGAHWITSLSLMNAVTDIPFDINGVHVGAGTRLPGSAKFQISNVAAYEHSLFGGINFGASITHAYIGASADAVPQTGTVGGYSTLDARLVLAKRDSRYQPEISIGMNNIANNRGVAYHQHLNTVGTNQPIDLYHYITPRTLVGNLSFKF